MVYLTRQEKVVIVFLLTAMLIGIGLKIYRKSIVEEKYKDDAIKTEEGKIWKNISVMYVDMSMTRP